MERILTTDHLDEDASCKLLVEDVLGPERGFPCAETEVVVRGV